MNSQVKSKKRNIFGNRKLLIITCIFVGVFLVLSLLVNLWMGLFIYVQSREDGSGNGEVDVSGETEPVDDIEIPYDECIVWMRKLDKNIFEGLANIYVDCPKSGTQTTVAAGQIDVWDIVVSSDQRHIAYIENIDDVQYEKSGRPRLNHKKLVILNGDEPVFEKLVLAEYDSSDYDVSPSGAYWNTSVFFDDASGQVFFIVNEYIYRFDLGSGNLDSWDLRNIDFGNNIVDIFYGSEDTVYMTTSNYLASYFSNIYMMNLLDFNITPIIEDISGEKTDIVITRDEKYIGFLDFSEGVSTLVSVNVETKDKKEYKTMTEVRGHEDVEAKDVVNEDQAEVSKSMLLFNYGNDGICIIRKVMSTDDEQNDPSGNYMYKLVSEDLTKLATIEKDYRWAKLPVYIEERPDSIFFFGSTKFMNTDGELLRYYPMNEINLETGEINEVHGFGIYDDVSFLNDTILGLISFQDD